MLPWREVRASARRVAPAPQARSTTATDGCLECSGDRGEHVADCAPRDRRFRASASHSAEKPLMRAFQRTRQKSLRIAARSAASGSGQRRCGQAPRAALHRSVISRRSAAASAATSSGGTSNARALWNRFRYRSGRGADHRQAVGAAPRRTPCRILRSARRARTVRLGIKRGEPFRRDRAGKRFDAAGEPVLRDLRRPACAASLGSRSCGRRRSSAATARSATSPSAETSTS